MNPATSVEVLGPMKTQPIDTRSETPAREQEGRWQLKWQFCSSPCSLFLARLKHTGGHTCRKGKVANQVAIPSYARVIPSLFWARLKHIGGHTRRNGTVATQVAILRTVCSSRTQVILGTTLAYRRTRMQEGGNSIFHCMLASYSVYSGHDSIIQEETVREAHTCRYRSSSCSTFERERLNLSIVTSHLEPSSEGANLKWSEGNLGLVEEGREGGIIDAIQYYCYAAVTHSELYLPSTGKTELPRRD